MNLKKIIVIIIAFIITLFIIVFFYNNGKGNKVSNELIDEQRRYLEFESKPGKTIEGKIPSIVTNESTYMNIKDILSNYFTCLKNKMTKRLLSYLKDNYIEKNKITEENIYEKLNIYNNYDNFEIIDIYELVGVKFTKYYVNIKIDGKDDYYEIATDLTNSTFYIYPMSAENYNTEKDKKIEYATDVEETIEKKSYNYFGYANYDKEKLKKIYICDLMDLLLNDIDKAYSLLDENYKKKVFPTKESFKEYINKNKERFQAVKILEIPDQTQISNFDEYYNLKLKHKNWLLDNYTVTKKDNYIEYLYCDNDLNYYVIKVTSPGKYTFMFQKDG